jgi:hypothetical protein
MKGTSMKRIAIIAALLLSAGLCLAQSDSAQAKTDSVKVSVEVQNSGSDDASVTVTTGQGKTDSTVTIRIGSEPRRDMRRLRRRDWALGIRASTLMGLPGNMFLQRRVARMVFVGCGLEYQRNPYYLGLDIPSVDRVNYDNRYGNGEIRNSYSAWAAGVSPECIVTCATVGAYRFSSGLAGSYKYYQIRGSNYDSDYSDDLSDTTYTSVVGNARYEIYTLSLPVIIERSVYVRKHGFAVGIQAELFTLQYSRERVEWDREHCPYIGPIDLIQSGYYRAYPLRIEVRNPFQSTVSLLLKWYL